MKKDYAFILNPASRGGKNRVYLRWLESWAQKRFPKAPIWHTERPGHATQLAQEAGEQGYGRLVVVGGDGTLNEVANGVVPLPKNKRPGIAMLSRGTGGDFGRRLKELYSIPQEPDWLQDPKEVAIDIGRATLHSKRGVSSERYFINITGVGLGGEVVRRVNAGSKWLGSLEYLRSTLLGAWHYQAPQVKIRGFQAEGKKFPETMKLLMFVLAKGRYFGGGMCIAPEAELDDGQFQILAAPKISYASLLTQLPKVYRKQRSTHEQVYYGTATQVTLEALQGTLPLDIDGEYFSAHQVEFEILPKALKMLVAF